MKKLIPFFVALLITQAHGEKFSNKYIEFDIPPGFSCRLDSTEWVCQPIDKSREKEALIVFAAKIKGAEDDLHSYEAHLSKSRVYKSPTGKPTESKVKFVKMKDINGHQWVYSLHLSSELPLFYTTYLVTTMSDLAVLYTFSVAQEKYSSYARDIIKTISSLRVFRTSGEVSPDIRQAGGSILGPDPEEESQPTQIAEDPSMKNGPKTVKKSASTSETAEYLLYGLIAVGAIGFIMWRKRRG